MMLELPCGVVHEGQVYDQVRVKEITGKQQNYLIDMELVQGGFGHVPKLLEDLCSELYTKEGLQISIPPKELIWKYTASDIELMLIKIREETYSPALALPTVCPHCSKQQMKKIDLDKIEVRPLADKLQPTKSIELPKSKQTISVKLLNLKDLFTLHASLRNKPDALYTSSMYLSIEKIGDKIVTSEEEAACIPMADLVLVEKAFTELQAYLDTKIINDCVSCNKEYIVDLPVMDPSFFVLSQTPST